MSKDGGPAFPISGYRDGMSLRDYFAAKALPVLIVAFSESKLTTKSGDPATEDIIAEQAYYFADAMLKARES